MRVRLSGSTITAHGDNLGAPYVEFPGNEPLGFSTNWTVSGSSPTRKLLDPSGHEYSVELPTQTAPAGSGSGVTVDNGVDAPAAVTTLVAPGAVIAGSSATLINLQLLGPFPVAWNTPGFMTPPDDWGPELLTIPAGCLFQVFAFITTIFNQPGFMEIRLTPDPTGFAHAIDVVKYYGVSTPRVDTGAAVESRRVISSETGVGTLDNVLPRWGFTPDERSVVASYQPDADDATAGAADIYALIATPAV